jgi:hypothetical protein
MKKKYVFALGYITALTVKNFPVLKRISMRHLALKYDDVEEPHWYTNAHALSYCLVRSHHLF